MEPRLVARSGVLLMPSITQKSFGTCVAFHEDAEGLEAGLVRLSAVLGPKRG